MLPAIQIDDESAFVTDETVVAAALDGCWHRLSDATHNVWQCVGWQVVEQAYDLPDMYLSYIEVQADAPYTAIPIRCPKHDLYWLYPLRGGLAIATADGGNALVKTNAGHYRISYLPAARYTCRFNEGSHQLFYVVHKPRALLREKSPELDAQTPVVTALAAQLNTHATSEGLPMRDGAAEAIHRFLRMPGATYLRRKQAVEHLALELVFIAYESAQAKAGGKQITAEWAEQISAVIDTCVAAGKPVDADILAERFGVSAVYVRTLFKIHHRITIGVYITQRKLEYSAQLLAEGDHPASVARYLGWTPAYFSRAYRARFGKPPGQRGATSS